MKRHIAWITLFALVSLLNCSSALSAALDDYYLEHFGENGSQHSPVAVSATAGETAFEPCSTPLHHGLRRDWSKLAVGTQQVLAKYLSKPTLTGTETVFASAGGHFNIHYASSGTDAPPVGDTNGNGIPDWVETVSSVFEEVYSREVIDLGFRPAPTAGGTPYDVYLQNLGGATTRYLGVTTSDMFLTATSAASFITIDNDFIEFSGYTPLEFLKITAAHEYHHAIQYGYNFFFDIWYAEATSTWIEDEVYDEVDQLYGYIAPYMRNPGLSLETPVSLTTGGGYGRWIFNRHLAEERGINFIRQIWERLSILTPVGASDIPMVPVIDASLQSAGTTLADEFLSFSRKLYLRNWKTHTIDTPLIHPVVPVTTYNAFPVNGSSLPLPGAAIQPRSFAFYRFLSGSGAPSVLAFSFGPFSQGILAMLFDNRLSGAVNETLLSEGGLSAGIPGFTGSDLREVVLVLVDNGNSSGSFSFSTDGSVIPVPPGGFAQVSGSAVTPPPSTTVTAKSSGGGGCFIATAAYGSYLHPKVRLLREFRDRWLLTNPLGRLFVRAYYHMSPPAAALIARHEWLRRLCRVLLEPVVLTVEYPELPAALMVGLSGWLLARRRESAAAG